MNTKRKNINTALSRGNYNSICFVAGKSGGHIIPCLTKAKELLAAQSCSDILFFSTTNALDSTILKDYESELSVIALPSCTLRIQKLWKLPQFIYNLATAFIKAFYTLYSHRPSKIISMGEIISIPVCIAGWILRIPIELYELNVIPGKTIKFLAPFAQSIYCCFQETAHYLPNYSCTIFDYPIRFTHAPQISKIDACKELNLDPNKKTILILGGSQGSLFINNLIKEWIENAESYNFNIIHQTGSNDTTDWHSWYAQRAINANVFSFNPNMESCYAGADLIICRSGSGTLHEVAFFKKNCITIPIQTKTTDHQRFNAYAMAQKYNYIKVVEERDASLFKRIMKEYI